MTKYLGVFRNADETKQVPAGALIFAEGDPGEEMFGVISGVVELVHAERVVATLSIGEVFGEMALVDSTARSLTARAIEDTELAVIGRRTFLFLVHETPTFALQVMSSLADRLRQYGVS